MPKNVTCWTAKLAALGLNLSTVRVFDVVTREMEFIETLNII